MSLGSETLPDLDGNSFYVFISVVKQICNEINSVKHDFNFKKGFSKHSKLK